MAVITIARELGAWGENARQLLAKRLNATLIDKNVIESRLDHHGLDETLLQRYDERKPGFFSSFSADQDKVRDSADVHVMVQGQRTVNAIRAQEAIALNASGDFAGAQRKMALNRQEMGTLRARYAPQMMAAPAAEAALEAEETWNASAENALGGSLAPKASKALNTRSFQTQYQQTTPQDGF